MESNYPDPKLSLQPFDPDVFQRVWNRVMPDQEHSPIAVDAPTLPAVPTLSPAPEEAPEPAPEVPLTCLGEGSQRYVQTINRYTYSRAFSAPSSASPAGAPDGPLGFSPPCPPICAGICAACPPPTF